MLKEITGVTNFTDKKATITISVTKIKNNQ